MDYTILVTDDRFGNYKIEENILSDYSADIVINTSGSIEEYKRWAEKADALLTNMFTLDAEALSYLKRCKIISRYGIGYDNVDVEAASRLGIWVARVPDYCGNEVAEHGIGLILALLRKIPIIDTEVRNGKWNIHSRYSIPRLAGKTLGVIGYGTTGKQMVKRLAAFKPKRILVADSNPPEEEISKLGAEVSCFSEIIEESDIISLHVPLRNENKHLINESVLKRMKNSAYLVNTSRGGIVDTQALVRALQTDEIAGAALDVFEEEPPAGCKELMKLHNVIVTDHAAYYSQDSVTELKEKAALNIRDVLNGYPPRFPVNSLFP